MEPQGKEWYKPLLEKARSLWEQVQKLERALETIHFTAPENFTEAAAQEWETTFKAVIRNAQFEGGVDGGLAQLERQIRKIMEKLNSKEVTSTTAQRATVSREIGDATEELAKLVVAASGLIQGFKELGGNVEYTSEQSPIGDCIGQQQRQEEQSLRVVIVGASSGLGRALALEYANRGATMVLAARREDLLKEVAEEAAGCSSSVRVTVIQTDVRDKSQTDVLMEEAASALGCVDVLIINSGVMGWACAMKTDPCSLADMNEALVATNFRGVVNVMKSALPYIRERWQSRTRVAITSSMAALTISNGGLQQPLQALFAASKLMVEGFVKSLRLEECFPILVAYPSYICDTEHYGPPMLYPAGYPQDGPKPLLKLPSPITAAQAAFVYRCGIEREEQSIFFDHCSKMYQFYHSLSRDVSHFLQCFISQPMTTTEEEEPTIPSEFIDVLDEHHYRICQNLVEEDDVRPLHTRLEECDALVASFRGYLRTDDDIGSMPKKERLALARSFI